MTNLAKTLPLKAGKLELLFDPATASLRYLRVGNTEVLRGVYAAVRDANWGTVPFVLSDLKLEQTPDSFALTFTSTHQEDDIHFVWQGTVVGESNSKVTFRFDGEAKSTFKRNRIGFCVLHPMSAAGQACVVEHTDGTQTDSTLPETIAPHQPFKDIRKFGHDAGNGIRASVTMLGDTFEMEDQRNWTDASFKTYCTPLEQPFPVEVEKGTRVEQKIIVELDAAQVEEAADEGLQFSLTRTSKPLPTLGLGAGRRLLSSAEIDCLKALNLDHLRLDLDLQADYAEDLKRVINEAKELDCKLELALHLSEDAEKELETLEQKIDSLKPPLVRVLVFHKDEKSTAKKWLELARQHLPNVPLAGGTDAFFTELNRERPPLDALDLVTYSLNPQVHAFDDASLVETLAAQATTVESAESFSGDKSIIISPITFKMRNNPNATGDKTLCLEEQVDPRQHTLFGAGWTLGSLKYLLGSNAASLTYFETTGDLGVIKNDGGVYPLYHVFADVGEFAGGEILGSSSNQPLTFEGFFLNKNGRERILLANFSTEPQTVHLSSFTGAYRGRVLDESTLEQATLEPEAFRSTFPLNIALNEGFALALEPYTLLTLDKL